MLVALSVPCAVLPVLAFLWLIWWMDRYDREPLWLFALAFLWGAGGGAVLALVTSNAALGGPGGLAVGDLVRLAPLVEEPAKALILLLIVTSQHFDNTTDGFVYGAAAGLGFGMTENLIYFSHAAQGGDVLAFALLVVLRSLYSALMHAAATSVVGASLGWAKFRHGAARFLVLPAGMAVALGIHGLWNQLLAAGAAGSLALGLLDFVLFPLEFGVLFGIFQLCLLDEKSILQRELKEEVDLGVIPPEHLPFLGAYRKRSRPGWLPAGMDHRAYVRAATTLAFRKHQLRFTAAPDHYAVEVTRLRQAILQLLVGGGIAPQEIPALGVLGGV
jgi:RsiW-degrading membrane proteinase PrsW (M82 family)